MDGLSATPAVHPSSRMRASCRCRCGATSAWIVIPHGQKSLGWFSVVALAGAVIALVLIPLTLLAVFSKGGATAHDWLEHDHDGAGRGTVCRSAVCTSTVGRPAQRRDAADG